jgi:Domain of unknown function (DUF4157)
VNRPLPAKESVRTNTVKLGPDHREHPILHLRRAIGNQAVQRMLQTDTEEPEARSTAAASLRFGQDFSRIPVHSLVAGAIQTKLAINKPGDEYEEEADRISERVVRMPEPQIQRACACGGACPSCQTEQLGQEYEHLQTKRVRGSDTGQIAPPPIVHEVLAARGQPLDSGTRRLMEPRFGHDFSRVRVHTGELAAESAGQIHARAYTVGHHVVFGVGQYAPNTSPGLKLIAHELTHVLQQGAAGESGVLQRERAPNAKTWTGAPSKCGTSFCRPLPFGRDAKEERQYLWPFLALGISRKVTSRVVPLWYLWASGGSSSVLNLTNTFGAAFSASLTTLRTTEFLIGRIKAKLTASPPTVPPAAGHLKLDIPTLIPTEVKAIDDPAPDSSTAMNFNVIGEIPGNIAGGIAKDQAATPIGANPSPQNDERIAKGTLEVFDTGPTLTVMPDLSYTVKDTVDLCPGDCGIDLEQKATVPMSQWEASGISGDVPYTVDFPATSFLLVPFAIPKPPPVSP